MGLNAEIRGPAGGLPLAHATIRSAQVAIAFGP